MIAIYFTLVIHSLNDTNNLLPRDRQDQDKNLGHTTIDNRKDGWIRGLLARIGSPQNSQIAI